VRASGYLPKIVSVFLLAFCFSATAYWLHLDRVDLHDLDCGGHALYALRIHELIGSPTPENWRILTEDAAYYYPPFAQFVGALSLFVFRPSGDVLILVSLFVFGTLLFYACNGLERRLTGSTDVPVSGYLSLLAPGLVNLSRRYYLDMPLAAMVCAGVYCLVRSENFENRRWSILLGVVVGLGMLTKWTYPIFVAGPLLVAFIALLRSKQRRHRAFNLLLSLAITAVISAPWYLASISRIVHNYSRAQTDAALANMPPVLSLPSLRFYPLNMFEYAWGHILSAVLVLGLLLYFFRKGELDKSFWTLATWLLFPVACLTLLSIKSFRFASPIVPAGVLLLALGLGTLSKPARAVLKALLIAFFSFLFILNLKGDKYAIDQHYPIWPPTEGDWRVAEIADDIIEDHGLPIVYFAVLPSIDEFYSGLFEFQLEAEGYRMEDLAVPHRVRWESNFWEILLNSDMDYILTKTGRVEDDPFPHVKNIDLIVVSPSDELAERYRLFKRYPLPDGSEAVLFVKRGKFSGRNVLTEPPPADAPVMANFAGKVELYSASAELVGPSRIHARYVWRCLSEVERVYRFFVHFEGDADSFAQDHWPLDGRYPTSMWRVGDVVVEEYRFDTPKSARSGYYDVYIGVFEELPSGEARNLEVVEHRGAGRAERDAAWVTKIELH